jgi:hypothetical protein
VVAQTTTYYEVSGMTNYLSELHAMCHNLVSWAGSCPEATVGMWLASILTLLTQAGFLVKRLVVGKNVEKEEDDEDDEEVLEVPVPTLVPYVPGDTVMKILKLLETQETGWRYEVADYGFGSGSNYSLHYGDLCLTKVRNAPGIEICHKGIDINLAKRSKQPDLDRLLINGAFLKRARTEAEKCNAQAQKMAREAEVKVNRELTEVLDEYV